MHRHRRRRPRFAPRTVASSTLVLVALALVASACGGDSASVRAEGGSSSTPSTAATTLPPDASVSSPPQTLPVAKTPYGGAQRVVPVQDAAGVNPLSFDTSKVKEVDGGLLVRFWGGVAPCFVLDHFDVTETPGAVTIALFAGHENGKDDVACIEIAALYEVKVPLDAPLGNRTVVDAHAS
jgi:hypothetical protein